MLKLVLQAIEATKGPVHVAELSRRLDIERSALEGMIAYWVRKGRLRDESEADCEPARGHCGTNCAGVSQCAFVVRMPKSYTVPLTCAKIQNSPKSNLAVAGASAPCATTPPAGATVGAPPSCPD